MVFRLGYLLDLNIVLIGLCLVLSSVYQSFQKFGTALSDNLNYLIVDCDVYRLAIRPVGAHVVCICADHNTGLGILKLKLNSLSDSLLSLVSLNVYST